MILVAGCMMERWSGEISEWMDSGCLMLDEKDGMIERGMEEWNMNDW